MSNETKRGRIGIDLTEGPILKNLFSFAIPMILASLVQQLYSMVDLAVIGQYVGSVGTVAVSTGSELSDVMTMLAMAFTMAGQIYMAQLAGAKDFKRLKEAMGTLFTVALILSAISVFFPILFHKPLLNMLNCPKEAYAEAARYLIITSLGLPFVFGYNAICAVLRSMGESRRPLIFIIIAATVNIVFDLVLVAWFNMGAAGTAIATAASQAGSFFAAYSYFYKNRDVFGFELKRSFFKIYKQPLRVMIRLGIPQLVRTLCVQGSMLWVKSHINSYGLTFSATYSIGNKIEKFMNVFVQGVDGAAGGMVGQNIGARKHDRVIKILWTTLAVTMCLGTAAAFIFLAFPKPLYRLFTVDQEVIEFGVTFLRIMSVGCLVVAFSGTFKSMSTGAGAAGLSFIIGVLDGVCRIAICLFCTGVLNMGGIGYFWGAALCQLIPGVVSLLYSLSGKWKTKKLLSET